MYRLGRLHLNSSGLCAIRMKALIDYWQIDELLLGKDYASVCWPKFNIAPISGKKLYICIFKLESES